MADHDLIDTYLDHLAQHLRWRDDSEDLLAEAGDHLHTAVERSVAAGADRTLAQERTLERFGQPDLVATAFATTNRGAVAVPTYFTKQAGTIAMVSAALWVVAVACWGIASRIEDSAGEWNGAAQAAYGIGAVSLIGAAVLTAVVAIALRERHGDLGWMGSAGLGFLVLGTTATLVSWLLIGWGLLIAAGTLLFGTAMRRVDLAPRAATTAFGGAWPLALVIWSALRAAEVGTADEWGDYWAANWTFLVVGSAIFAAGLLGLGRWLRSEQPAEMPPVEALAEA